MKRVLLTIAAGFLRLVYIPIRRRPVQRKVTIISRQSDRPSLDIRMLQRELARRHPDVECTVLCRAIGPGIGGKLSYLLHMITQMKHIAASRVVVLDGYCIAACVLRHKPETKIIQMWHAVAAIKRFGYQTIGLEGGHSSTVAEVLCMHRNYDHVLCCSETTGEIFCEAFRTTPDHLLYMGLPRLDRLQASGREKLREEFRIPEDREILLYVPTFRRGQKVPLQDLIEAVNLGRFTLVIRLHPLDEPPEELRGTPGVIIDTEHSTQRWLRACDRIITDYSALAVEASITGKPLYYYIYDIDSYERNVGLNVDPRIEMPHAAAVTAEELRDLLEKDYDFGELQRFRDKYITVDTHGCTARLGEFIYGIVEEVH